MLLSDTIRNMTIARRGSNEIDAQAKTEGMTSLAQSGIEKIRRGITTCTEVLRVTRAAVPAD